jgi:hypothetical protein
MGYPRKDRAGQGETPGCGQIAVNVLGIRASDITGEAGGCEKHASEPGDEAFEVGARPFSMLRSYLHAALYG